MAKRLKHKLLNSEQYVDFLKQLNIEELYSIIQLPLFNQITEKDFYKIKEGYGEQKEISSNEFYIYFRNDSTKSKFIGELMYESSCKIMIQNYLSGDTEYYVGILSFSVLYNKLNSIASNDEGLNINTAYTNFDISSTDNLDKVKEELSLSNINIENVAKHEYILTRCTQLFSTGHWYRSGQSKYAKHKFFRRFHIVVDNSNGLLYGVLISDTRGTRSTGDKHYYSIAEQIMFRIADTKSAMAMYKKIQTEEIKRSTLDIVADMFGYNQTYTYTFPELQRNNVKEQQEYISKIGEKMFNSYKEYISYFDGELQLDEVSDIDITIEDESDEYNDEADEAEAAARLFAKLQGLY